MLGKILPNPNEVFVSIKPAPGQARNSQWHRVLPGMGPAPVSAARTQGALRVRKSQGWLGSPHGCWHLAAGLARAPVFESPLPFSRSCLQTVRSVVNIHSPPIQDHVLCCQRLQGHPARRFLGNGTGLQILHVILYLPASGENKTVHAPPTHKTRQHTRFPPRIETLGSSWAGTFVDVAHGDRTRGTWSLGGRVLMQEQHGGSVG